MIVQTVWFQTKHYTKAQAAAWCEAHDFSTANYSEKLKNGELTHHRFIQFDAADAVENSFRVLSDDFPAGISVTICERKSMKEQFTKGVQSSDDPFEFVMSDESTDRVGDVIRASGWDLKDFEKNPVALFGHNHDKPIGVWENVRVVGKKLVGKLRLAKQGTSAEIDTIRSLVEQRILKSVSVGFQPVEAKPLKSGGYEFITQKLHECSLVAVPANANALAIAKNLGADPAKIFSQAEDHQGVSDDVRALKKYRPMTNSKLADVNSAIERIEKHLGK